MTIASEISRLQNDKSCICAAIENKWVTVWNVSLDDYASCIDAIEQGGGAKNVEYLMVAWWWWGGGSRKSAWGWGGWAWWARVWTFIVRWNSISVTVGAAWAGWAICCQWCSGGDSCILDACTNDCIIAHGWWWGGHGICSGTTKFCGLPWWSWWGAGWWITCGSCVILGWCSYGYPWEMGSCGGSWIWCTFCNRSCTWSGGWGASWSGYWNANFCNNKCNCVTSSWRWWKWMCGTWGWKTVTYAGWWGGGTALGLCCRWMGMCGGWDGWYNCPSHCDWVGATSCWSWWGGWWQDYENSVLWKGGNWAKWLVIIWYNCECKDCNGFTCATGGASCYVCNWMKYHCFTSNWTFTIVS